MADQELVEIADDLYALPLGEFTAARDARAKELKGSDLAAPVKALKKPSLAAWVVNLLVRRDAEQVDQVLSLGAALREAAAGMDGEELRNLTRQRRQLTAAVTTGARALLIGGEPFAEEMIMWWNFIGRSHEEIVAARQDWMAGLDDPTGSGSRRFGSVEQFVSYLLNARPQLLNSAGSE